MVNPGASRAAKPFVTAIGVTLRTHHKGILAIAEFVENDESFTKQRQLGVDFGQGFGISRLRPLTPLIQ